MTKSRGILIVVALAALGGVLWFVTRGRETAPTKPVAATGSGSAVQVGKTARVSTSPARATITVAGPQGPLAGATVRLSQESGEVIILQTAATGSVTSDALEPGLWTISASAAGHEPAAATPRDLPAGETVRIELTLVAGGRTLSGLVTDASGGPIAGARIDAAKVSATTRPSDAVASTQTGADGRYSLTVAAGMLLVAASEASYAPQSRYVEVGADGAVANFSLVPGGVIEGVVRDEGTKAIVPGAFVTARRVEHAMSLGERQEVPAIAGADGRFRIGGLRPGGYELTASAEAQVSRAPTVVGLGVAEQITDVEILVGRTPIVRGTVIDETGAPAPAVGVMVFGGGRGGSTKATSDAGGAFTLEGMTAGRYTLLGNGGVYLTAGGTSIEVADADLDGVTVKVKHGATLTGHVEPRQAGCEVRVEASEDLGPMHAISPLPPRQTGLDGSFAFEPLDLVTYNVQARCTTGAQGTKPIAIVAGANDVTVEVTAGASIAGTVVDGSGKPVAGVTVMASPLGDTERTTIVNGRITSGEQTVTSMQGTFELRGLPAGTYTMGVLERGRPLPMKREQSVKVAAAEAKTGVTLAIDRPDGTMRGVVVGPDGTPLADAWVSVHVGIEDLLDRNAPQKRGTSRMVRVERTDDGAGDVNALAPVLTDASGAFTITNLARTPMTVLAEAESGKLRGQQVGVTPDATVTIKALAVTDLSGTVRASGPLTSFTVELSGPTREQRSFASRDGTFSFARVDPGTYKVSVTSARGNGDASVTIEAGKPATVEVVLAANAVVTGKVIDKSGKPVGELPVVLIPDTGGGQMQVRIDGPPLTTAADGTFRVEGKAGPSILVVMAPPVPTFKRVLQLAPGTTTDIGSLTLGSGAPPPP